MTVLFLINLLNYMDRFAIAGMFDIFDDYRRLVSNSFLYHQAFSRRFKITLTLMITQVDFCKLYSSVVTWLQHLFLVTQGSKHTNDEIFYVNVLIFNIQRSIQSKMDDHFWSFLLVCDHSCWFIRAKRCNSIFFLYINVIKYFIFISFSGSLFFCEVQLVLVKHLIHVLHRQSSLICTKMINELECQHFLTLLFHQEGKVR